MRSSMFGWSLLCLGGLCCTLQAEEPKDPLATLQGEWQATQFVDNGYEIPKPVVDHLRVTIKGDKLSYVLPDVDDPAKPSPLKIEIAIAVHADQPQAMDAKLTQGPFKEKLRYGIYDLEKDTLRICLPLLPTAKRVTTFESVKGSGLCQLTLRRINPATLPK